MSEDWTQIRARLLAILRPSDEEVRTLGLLIQKLESDLTGLLKKGGFKGEARVHGSAARGIAALKYLRRIPVPTCPLAITLRLQRG